MAVNLNLAFPIPDGLSLNDNVGIFDGFNNPSLGVGESAPTGSMFLRSGTSETYVKYGSLDTEWRLFGSVTSIILTGSTGLSISGSPITTSGTISLTLDTGLQNLASFSSTGILVSTGVDTWTSRSLSSGSSKISISNADGVVGNPTLDVVESNLTLDNIGGVLSISKGGTGQITAISAFNALSPLTTKGDILTFDTQNVRLPAGANGQILMVDSTTSSGLKWATINGSGTVSSVTVDGTAGRITSTGSPITTSGTITIDLATVGSSGTFETVTVDAYGRVTSGVNILTTKGDLYTFGTSSIRLPVGTDGQFLSADSTTPTGLKWTSPATGSVTSVAVTGSTGLSVSGSPITSSGTISLTLDSGLQNLASFSTTGLVIATGTDTWTSRTLLGTVNQITVSNGSGVSGDPTISIANDVQLPGTGSVLVPSGTTAQRTVSPIAGMMRYNSSSGNMEYFDGATWVSFLSSSSVNPADNASLFDDFINGNNTTTNGSITENTTPSWLAYINGTGSRVVNTATGVDNVYRCIGVLDLQTGTNNSGLASISYGDNTTIFGYAHFDMEWRVCFSTLATVAQNYNAYIGFIDKSQVSGEPVDGIYFKYNFSTSPNWILTTSSNSTRTNVITSIPVDELTSNDFQKLRIVVSDDGTLVTFYINGTQVGTISTNIPTTAGRQTGIGVKIQKSAGTTNRSMFVDYVSLAYTYPVSR